MRSLRDRRFKFIDGPTPELYDLERDPFEERNIYDERRELASAFKRRLAMLTSNRGLQPAMTHELRERLAALGYIDAHHSPPRE